MLSALLQTATKNELEYIAALDYGQDTEKHLAALRAVIFDQSGVLTDDQRWFPYEVIELGSHVLTPGHEREFFFCTMLVLHAAHSGYDTSVELSDKLADHATQYDQLPNHLRDEVIRAYQLAGA
jgi:hypothetical protein